MDYILDDIKEILLVWEKYCVYFFKSSSTGDTFWGI